MRSPERISSAVSAVRADPAPAVKVLVIDDSLELIGVLADRLSTAGYSVGHAQDPGHALFALLRGEPVDVVLADVRMPGLSGPRLYALVVARRPALKDRFIFMTGSTLLESDKIFIGQERVPLLFKPFSGSALLQTVAQAMRGPILKG
jgi:two-component system NtrC family sensor kinase